MQVARENNVFYLYLCDMVRSVPRFHSHICIGIYIYICVYTYMYVYMCINYIRIQIYIMQVACGNNFISLPLRPDAKCPTISFSYIYWHIHIHMYTYIYVYICMNIYMYTNIYNAGGAWQ